MSDDLSKYKQYVDLVLQECKEAEEQEIAIEFKRYEDEFLIPPKDSLRSIIRKFSPDGAVSSMTKSDQWKAIEKIVDRFSELDSEDRNVTVEAYIVSYTPKVQAVRGEERQIAFGWIEDNPWKNSGDRERWNYTDWGNHHEALTSGSIVRLEGVSINEWKGNKSININQTSRVTVLKEGGPATSLPTDEPISLNEAMDRDGFVNIVARLHSLREDVIVSKESGKEFPIVRGRLVDKSGTMTFVSWVPFSQEPGTLLKIDGASIRRFRDNPEINFGDNTKIELYRDSKFPSLEKLEKSTKNQISSLKDGMNDVSIVLQVESWISREFTDSEGEQKVVRSGDVLDPTGRCRLTCWSEFEPEPGAFLKISGARVQSWNGSPDLVIDTANQAEIIDEGPWETIDPESHWVEVGLTELVSSGSRRGIGTTGHIVSVREDCGLIERCPECRRVLRDGACQEHGPQRGEEDLRLRFVIDNGISNASLIVGKESSEALLGIEMSEIAIQISTRGADSFKSELRAKLLGQRVVVRGRSFVDQQGAMIIVDEMSNSETHNESLANEVMSKWGVDL